MVFIFMENEMKKISEESLQRLLEKAKSADERKKSIDLTDMTREERIRVLSMDNVTCIDKV